ncbi:MAG: GNAT family N-acetyltransferase [Actinomycetota bacterium]|nr:GNAT family N-acetyltransferase [Actinomycetota bacterium]
MLFESHLADGRRVLFRPIEPGDKELLADGFRRLSPQSRYRRFFRSIDHLSEAQLRYLTEVDQKDHVAWVAVLPDEPNETGAGVARWIRLADEPGSAEGAVTVVDELQGLGIGKTLLHLLAHIAIEQGIRSFKAWVLGDNQQVQTMLKGIGATPGAWEGGVLEMTIPLPADPAQLEATPAPLILKAVAAGQLEGRAATEAGRTHLSTPDEAHRPSS